MRLFKILFSPTGGTKKVCDILAGEFQGEQEYMDLMHMDALKGKTELMKDDICLIAVPSYGGRVPAPVTRSLQNIQGNHAKAILVVTFGNRAYEDTLLELQCLAEKAGFSCIAAITAITEHSIMRQYGSGRPDEQDKKELTEYANQIFCTQAMSSTSVGTLTVPGKQPYRAYSGVPFHPKAGNACNQCGVCASSCPVGAIRKENPRETDNETCITCMSCVAVCPQKARQLNRLLLAVASGKMKNVCSDRKENELITLQ